MRRQSNPCQPTSANVPRRITQMNHNAPAFRRLRSCATKEQLREYFEVRFRAEKYGVPYFFGRKRSEAKAAHGKRPQEQERAAVEDLNVQGTDAQRWA